MTNNQNQTQPDINKQKDEDLLPVDIPKKQKKAKKSKVKTDAVNNADVKSKVPSPADTESDTNYDVSKCPANVLDVIKKWDELFNEYSFNNLEYSKMCFHVIVGQLIRNCRMTRTGTRTDPRISVLYIKPTHTGGSAGYDMFAKIARRLGLRVETVSDATDAGLVGTVDSDGEVKGILDKSCSDIIYWAEGSWIFKDNLPPHQVKIRNYIQMALNPIDSEETKLKRKLKFGESLCECECSLVLVTFNPDEINDSLLKTGFVHRFSTVAKTVTIKERAMNATEDIMKYRAAGDIDNTDSSVDEIVTMLKHVLEFGKKNRFFTVTFNAKSYFSSKMVGAFADIEKLDAPERTKEHLASIHSSVVRKVFQYAMHHAALRFSKVIEEQDIDYAFSVINPQLETIKHYLEESTEHVKAIRHEEWEENEVMHNAAAYLMENNLTKPEIPKNDMLEIIAKTFKVSSTKSKYEKYNNLIKSGDIKETTAKTVMLLKYSTSCP